MKKGEFVIRRNERLTETVFRLVLGGDTTALTAPGQFAELQLPEFFLRRPFSVCDWDEESMTILYKVVGNGTRQLSEYGIGKKIDALVGLGNGFDVSACAGRTLVIGGGIGAAPMFALAKRLLKSGKQPTAILGFNTADEIFYEDEFRALGVKTIVATADGSRGVHGFVTDALPDDFDMFCACGPMPMLRALAGAAKKPGYMSLEARMGCGFGACMGCTIQTAGGPRRVCKDGPVFRKEELLWEAHA